MRVLVVEDEAPAAKRLVQLIAQIQPSAVIVEVCDSIESTVNWLQGNQAPDLIFMDIQLADGNSFLIFEQTEIKSPVIFATAYDEYAVRAFKVNSVDYLLKPIEKSELERALHKFKTLTSPVQTLLHLQDAIQALRSGKKEYKQRFLVRIADRLVPVSVEETRYFMTEDKVVFLQTETHKYPVDFTLDQLESMLDPKLFFRLNRKHLGHVQAIHKIFNHLNGKLKLILSPSQEEEVFVSREKAQEFKAWLEG